MGVLTPDDFTTSELDTWMSHALEEARAAESHGDVPVGAVVIHRHRVIAARHNERELTGDPTSHAEVLALRDAANVIGNWHLEECLLVVTLEPCVMCAGAMVNSRLGMLVFGAHDPKGGASGSCFDLTNSDALNHRIPQIAEVRSEESSQLLKRFFADRRR